jgi:3-deoxy-D-manno-octulosonate 8-phosphate phosphatase (KDO 8-P phosphatase)
VSSPHQVLANVRLVVFDVDGVLTDGRLYLSDEGSETKAFYTQDGFGIRRLLDAGLAVAVISGRESVAVAKRMSDLGVQHVIQGSSDKAASFHTLAGNLDISESQAVYVGDDVPDLPLLRRVGFSVAVSNAHDAVKAACDYTTVNAGGFGAVREVCDLVLDACQIGKS